MYAAVFEAPFELAMQERERPIPKQGEALVKVNAAGLCAGDLYIFLGKNPYVTFPRVGGHEIAGHIESLGPDTFGPKLGSHVVIEPFLGCGMCYPCRIGRPNCCADLKIIGAHQDGGFASYVVAPVEKLFAIPHGMSAYTASFAEPVAIGVQACRRGQVEAGDTVLILGAGPIGLALVEVANARGAKVFITDVLPERLETAANLGAIPIRAGGGFLDDIMQITNGEGMPVVIEATGSAAVMERTVDYVAAGGRIVIVGLVKKGIGVTFPGLDFTRKEMTIVGSRASTACFPDSLDLLSSGKIRYPEAGTRFSLADAPSVFAKLAKDSGAVHKAVFLLN